MAINTPHLEPSTSTIVWGTKDKFTTASITTGAIIESIAITPKNAGPIGEIEDGNGASVVNVMLDDGFDAKVTCVYDTGKTSPALGAAATLTVPSYAGGGTETAFICFVAGNHEISMSRKKEATITLNLRYRPGITAA
jgi:hypothetical protein